MAQLLISSQDETMRSILSLIGQDHHLTVTTCNGPAEAMQILETSETPLIALFDVWLDHWDELAEQRFARFLGIPVRHSSIVLWDAHIALPPQVRERFTAHRIQVVKKPLELALLDAALDAAIRMVVPPSPHGLAITDEPSDAPHP